jgi:hypothetical protein
VCALVWVNADYGAASPPDGLLPCDPLAGVGRRPARVFTTPAVLPNTSYPRDRVVYWVEHDANDDYVESHFLARFYDGGGVRACEVRSEGMLGLLVTRAAPSRRARKRDPGRSWHTARPIALTASKR